VEAIFAALPEGPAMFPTDITTDRGSAFRAAELIREQLLEAMHQEVPYGLTVEIEHMSQDPDGRWIVHGLIWLDRESHKPIVIGKQGHRLKRVGTRARQALIAMLGGSVHLELWVKVRAHWSDNELELQRFGYDAR
jgi:GTP-binding protein Era